MILKKKNLALITARGGSKRIKNKNIISFFGKHIKSGEARAAGKRKYYIFQK